MTPRIRIEWFAMPAKRGGWAPAIRVNGRVSCDSFPGGYSKDEAEVRARVDAEGEAARFIGEWEVEIVEGRVDDGAGPPCVLCGRSESGHVDAECSFGWTP